MDYDEHTDAMRWLTDRLYRSMRVLRLLEALVTLGTVVNLISMISAFIAGGDDELDYVQFAAFAGFASVTTLALLLLFDSIRRSTDIVFDEMADVVQRWVASASKAELDDEYDDSPVGVRRRLLTRQYPSIRQLPLIASSHDSAAYALVNIVILISSLYGLYR